MKKALIQLLILVLLFVGIWQALARIDWVTILKLERAGDDIEKKLGDMVWDFFRKTNEEITDPDIVKPIDSLLTKICSSNGVNRSTVKLHIIKNEQVNAFTLPAGRIAIFTGLIQECENAEELAGVIGHELAHMQLDHVMKKLVSEIGLAVLVSITTGGRGGEMAGDLLRVLSSSAYGRKLETEADRHGVAYLLAAKINPAPFADFMYRISDMTSMPESLTWIATHPNSKDRAKAIVEQIADAGVEFKPAIRPETWEQMQRRLKQN